MTRGHGKTFRTARERAKGRKFTRKIQNQYEKEISDKLSKILLYIFETFLDFNGLRPRDPFNYIFIIMIVISIKWISY